MKTVVASLTGSNNDHDGRAVYSAIQSALQAGANITLDFAGLDKVGQLLVIKPGQQEKSAAH